jgi:ABC-type antimicrobial peptide transport system permease subunit
LGLLAGILAAIAWIAAMLFGLTAMDPSTIFIAASVRVAGLLAAYLPACHASRIDPMLAPQ